MAVPKRFREGFDHRGMIVYALQYTLATDPLSWLIVWLDERGNSLYPHVHPAVPGRRMATVRHGDLLVHRGQTYTVKAVSIYRALGTEPGLEVVG